MGAGLGLALTVLGRASASTRYACSSVALLLLAIAPFVTFAVLRGGGPIEFALTPAASGRAEASLQPRTSEGPVGEAPPASTEASDSTTLPEWGFGRARSALEPTLPWP